MLKVDHVVPKETRMKVSNSKNNRSNWKSSKLSPQEISELVEGYRNGESHRQLAKRFGITKSAVSKRLQSLRIEKHDHIRRKLSKEDFHNTILPRYQNGESIESLAREYHISYSTLRIRFIRNNIKLRNFRKIEDRDIPNIIRRYQSGERTGEIAKDYNVIPLTIQHVLEKNNIPRIRNIGKRAGVCPKCRKKVTEADMHPHSFKKGSWLCKKCSNTMHNDRAKIRRHELRIRLAKELEDRIAHRNEFKSVHELENKMDPPTIYNPGTYETQQIVLSNQAKDMYGDDDSIIKNLNLDPLKLRQVILSEIDETSQKYECKNIIEKLYNDFRIPTTRIAPIIGVSKPSLLKFMHSNGIKIRTAGESKTKIVITDDMKNDIVRLYAEEKLSHSKIAEVYNVSQMTITKLLRKLGIKARMRNEYDKYILRNKELHDLISMWYHEYNLSQKDIAQLLGVGETSVHVFMKEMGIKTRSRSECLKISRKINLDTLNNDYESSIKHKKWRRNRKDAYNVVSCDQCRRTFLRTRSLASKRTFRFCSYQCFRDYSSNYGFLGGRHPNISEFEVLKILQNISLEFQYVGNSSKIIGGLNPDFWDQGKILIDLFGEPYHDITEIEERQSHFKKHGYEWTVVWWEELRDKKSLEARLREWYLQKMEIQKDVICNN
jgi:predicted XRE-type DNA-binding protein/DNA-binding MarR family transcriptional regulator